MVNFLIFTTVALGVSTFGLSLRLMYLAGFSMGAKRVQEEVERALSREQDFSPRPMGLRSGSSNTH